MNKFALLLSAVIVLGIFPNTVAADRGNTATYKGAMVTVVSSGGRDNCYRVSITFAQTPIPLLVPQDPPPWTIDPGRVTFVEHLICGSRESAQLLAEHWWDRNVQWTYLPIQRTRENLGDFMSCHLEDLVNGFGPSQIYKGAEARLVSFGGYENYGRSSFRWSQTGQSCPWF